MYSYQSAVVRDRGLSGRWYQPDLRTTRLIDLYQRYAQVWLILTHPVLTDPVALDMRQVDETLHQYPDSTTVEQWLTLLGDATLPTITQLPLTEVKTVQYNDVFQAGYQVRYIHPSYALDTTLPDEDLPDLLLTRANTNYSLFRQHCLVTINGLLHYVDASTQGIYVRSGGTSVRHADQHQLGVLSFREIGGLTCLPITPEMVYTPHEGASLYEGAYLHLPEPIGERIVLMSIGGYLQILDGTYQVVGDDRIRVNLARCNLVDRYQQSRELLDLSTMTEGFSPSDNASLVVLDELLGDAALTHYLSLPQSFVILLEADNLYVQRHKAENSGLANRYYSHQRPQWPLRTHLGLLPAYLASKELDQWVIQVEDNRHHLRRYHRHGYLNDVMADGQRDSARPWRYSAGEFLEIGSDVSA